MQTALDFFSGSHGNFLEYCINRYIYKTPSFADLLITETGTSHGLYTHQPYLDCKQTVCAHFTEFDFDTDAPTVVRIVIQDFQGQCCYQINVLNRAADITAEEREQELSSTVTNSPVQLRNYYYSKLNHDGYTIPGDWKYPGFDFEMSSLYQFESFLHELKRTADYLNLTFTPDQELGKLWQQFIAKNHGLQAWFACQRAMEQIFAGDDVEIKFDIQRQALLNCLISRSVGMYDGAMFDQDEYPATTGEIYQHIQQHIETFDSRFD